jgi:hypothetical protein
MSGGQEIRVEPFTGRRSPTDMFLTVPTRLADLAFAGTVVVLRRLYE